MTWAGDIVPGLDDGTAYIDLTAPQAGSAGDISPIEGPGMITLAVRFTPAAADLTATGPVILIETGGTSYGNGLYLAGGNLIWANKGSNGGNGNYSTQTSLSDTDVSDAAAAVTIGPVSAGVLTDAFVSYNSATGRLYTSLNGATQAFTITGSILAANLSGDESVSFLGSGAISAGQMGGLTNESQGQDPLWDANQAVNFTGMGGDIRGQIFAALAPEEIPPYTIYVSQTDGGTEVTEGGGSDAFSFVLTDDPGTYPVTIHIADLSDPDQVQLSASEVEITTSNWGSPPSVTVTAVDDALGEAKMHSTWLAFTVEVDPASEYAGATVGALTVSIGENDCETWGFHRADLNSDCQIDLKDMRSFMVSWLECSGAGPGCVDYRP